MLAIAIGGTERDAAACPHPPAPATLHALQAAASSPTTSPPPPRQSGTLTASTAPHATFLVRRAPAITLPGAYLPISPLAMPSALGIPFEPLLPPLPSLPATAPPRCAFPGLDSPRPHWHRTLPRAAGHLEQAGAGPGGGGARGDHAGRRAAHPPAGMPAWCARAATCQSTVQRAGQVLSAHITPHGLWWAARLEATTDPSAHGQTCCVALLLALQSPRVHCWARCPQALQSGSASLPRPPGRCRGGRMEVRGGVWSCARCCSRPSGWAAALLCVASPAALPPALAPKAVSWLQISTSPVLPL